MIHASLPNQAVGIELPCSSHFCQGRQIIGAGCLSVDSHMEYDRGNWRRRCTERLGLRKWRSALHEAVHGTGNVLAHGTADDHAGHHGSCMKTIPHYTAGSAVSHLAQCLGSGNADFCLFFHLEGSQMGALGLLMHCVLALLALHP